MKTLGSKKINPVKIKFEKVSSQTDKNNKRAAMTKGFVTGVFMTVILFLIVKAGKTRADRSKKINSAKIKSQNVPLPAENNKSTAAARGFLFVLFMTVVLLLAAIIILFATVDKSEREIFGLRLYHVQSGSMSMPEGGDEKIFFNAGDLIFVKDIENCYAMEAGDVITYISLAKESYGQTVTHKIRSVEYATNGELIGYVTYGIYKNAGDELVEPERVIGEYAGKWTGMGNFVSFLRSKPGLALMILFPSQLALALLSERLGRDRALRLLEMSLDAENRA